MNTKYSLQTLLAMMAHYGFTYTGDSKIDRLHATDNYKAMQMMKRDYPPRKNQAGTECESDEDHENRLLAMIFGE